MNHHYHAATHSAFESVTSSCHQQTCVSQLHRQRTV